MPPVVTDTTAWIRQAFPLPTVITLVLYTMGVSSFVTSWKADIDARIGALEKVVVAINSHENRIVVLEQQFLRIRDDMSEIKVMQREILRRDQKAAE